MTSDETHFVIAHCNTLDLFEDNKSLVFTSKEEAKNYLKNHLIKYLHKFWYITSVKDYNESCERWGVRYKEIEGYDN